MQANYVQRLRLVFAKEGPARYIGHLDLARTLERSLNRARIPLARTQGFNRRPRMQLADALPLGYTSEAEIADIWLSEAVDPKEARNRVAARAAPGLDVQSVREVPLREPALQTQTVSSTYVVTFADAVDGQQLESLVAAFMAQESVVVEKRGKAHDLRPLVLDLQILDAGPDAPRLMMELSLQPGKTARPDDLLSALGLGDRAAHLHRARLLLAEDPLAD